MSPDWDRTIRSLACLEEMGGFCAQLAAQGTDLPEVYRRVLDERRAALLREARNGRG